MQPSASQNSVDGQQSSTFSKKRKSSGDRGMPLLPWMRVPLEIEAGKGVSLGLVKGLQPALKSALMERGYQEFFPVQAASWQILAGGNSKAHDLCVCAPTGSGKTLAYAVPILQGLFGAVQGILRVLVVLPTRELAVQVYEVFASLCPSLGLWTGLAAARLPMPAEIAALRACPPNILVATPGRLMAHLRATEPTFSLVALQFLVIDETDRLLRQTYQDWLPFVTEAIRSSSSTGFTGSRTVKIVVSATLTQDPAKLERLQLHAPRYIAMSALDSRYKVPKELKEFKVVGAAPDKPVLLLAILEAYKAVQTLIFTASLSATHRLFLLLKQLLGDKVLEYSSSQQSKDQKHESGSALFKKQKGAILVTSDALTRGMDMPGVELVINYDTPTYPKTYVHRAGRTARAGNEGTVITILSSEQVHHYKAMLRKIDNTFVKDMPLGAGAVSELRPKVKEAIDRAALEEI